MSIKDFIDATRDGNAAQAEKLFSECVQERLSKRLEETKTQVVSEMFGLQSITEEDITEYLDGLSEEELDHLDSLSEEEATAIVESDIRKFNIKETSSLVRKFRSKSPGSN